MSFQLLEGEIGRVDRIDHDTLQIHTELNIDALPQKVWSILTDWEKLPEWSNNIVGLTGDFELGGIVTVTVKLGIGSLTRDLEHKLTAFEEGRTFGWSDTFLPGMKDDHEYLVEPNSNGGTRFVQRDKVDGFSANFVGGPVARSNMQTYVEFNRALKARAEGKAY